ncbi:MAG: hypothetical protein AAF633_19765 [Chloroflexota bacterium]
MRKSLSLLLLAGMGVVVYITLGFNGHVNLVEAGSVSKRTSSQAAESSILDATLRITMLYEGTGTDGIDSYFASNGLGTMVHLSGKQLVVTHNHWEAMDSSNGPAIVQFHTVENILLTEMSGDEFLKLIIYRDSGTIVFKTIKGQDQRFSVNLQAVTSIQSGDVVFLLHQDLKGRDGVVVFPARVISIEEKAGVERYGLQSIDGQSIHCGDSGGGIWKDGQYIGNMWTTVEVIKPGKWPWSESTIAYSDKSFGASITADIEEIVDLNLMDGEMPTSRDDGPG